MPRARGLDALAERLHEVRADACGALDARALRFLDAMRFALPDDAIVVADMCIPGYWLAGFYTPAARARLQIPLGWGTLGYAFPAALGAALAGAGPVVAMAGDGGFLFACGELATMAQERIPLTARDRRRRRLRDAALRPGRGGRRALRRRSAHARLRGAGRARSGSRAETVDGLDDEFGAALAAHVADPEPSVLVARTPEPLVPPPNTSPNWYRRKQVTEVGREQVLAFRLAATTCTSGCPPARPRRRR